ncbi:Fc receptor-like protein 5, partial [Brachionichthys hirsutus]|uniref:Fc receptor-like protein 5 n=1 Tax=Brachionichthys hirsutus TaxID=412623 RepID=UPI003604BC85
PESVPPFSFPLSFRSSVLPSLAAACLRVSPDQSQFFRYGSISLSCDSKLNSTHWKVKRNTTEGGVRPCSFGWGVASSYSTCQIGQTYPTDTGTYWCQSEDGDTSNSITITITDRDVILQSPVLPVPTGAAASLRCKAETRSAEQRFNFYKDGRSIISNTTGEMTIHSVSKSDEGLYMCGISGGGDSISSWLLVEDSQHIGVRLSPHSFTFSFRVMFFHQSAPSLGGWNSLPAVHHHARTHLQSQEASSSDGQERR